MTAGDVNTDKDLFVLEPPDAEVAHAGEKTATVTQARRGRSEWREGKYLTPISIGLYFLVWYALTCDGFNIVSSLYFPSPRLVIQAAQDVGSTLISDTWATSLRVIIGLATGVFLGVAMGLCMSFNKKVYYFFDPLIEMIRPVPVVAMIPFFLLWFGIAERGKFFLVVMGVFAIMVVSTVEAVRNVSKIFIRAAETLGASRLQIFRTIIVPAIIPELVGPLRVSAALSFTLVVAAEFMGAQAGLGFRIMEARQLFNTNVILLGVVLLGFLAMILDAVLRKLLAYLTRWSERYAG